MANAVYPLYKQSLISADTNVSLNVDTTQDGVYCAMVHTTAGYGYSAAHQYFSSVTNVIGTDQRITTPTVTSGTFDGTDLTYTAVTGAAVEALVLYRHNSGANTTWRLVVFEDTGVTGLPVTPNGGNITITWNASGIFTISDLRMKKNIKQVGKLGQFNLYEYSYLWSDKRSVGVLAQDVKNVLPHAIAETNGIMSVNYDEVVRLAA